MIWYKLILNCVLLFIFVHYIVPYIFTVNIYFNIKFVILYKQRTERTAVADDNKRMTIQNTEGLTAGENPVGTDRV